MLYFLFRAKTAYEIGIIDWSSEVCSSVLKDSACFMVCGANPSASAPHAHKHWLKETPAKVVVVDPFRHPTAEAADIHLQPFPGSDAALVFALLHAMRREGLIDREFLAAHAIGWEEVEAQLDPCTPEWGDRKRTRLNSSH